MEFVQDINALTPWFFPTMVFVLGACVGSFLNVCIYRIPAEKSVVTPGSTCACGTRIAWYDNIPIFSWLILRGRARCCARPFSVRYPVVELVTALLFLVSWMHHPPAKALVGMVFIAIMLCAGIIDLDHMFIPDRFAIGGAVAGVLISTIVPSLHDQAVTSFWPIDSMRGMIEAITGVFVGSGLVLWIRLLAEVILRKEAMGFGDVKFLGAIGAFTGWQGAVFAVFGGAVLGTVWFGLVAVHNLVFRRKRTPAPDAAAAESDAMPQDLPEGEQEPEEFTMGSETPYGPMLAAGALLYFLWLHRLVDAYFADLWALLTDFS